MEEGASAADSRVLDGAVLELPYIPEFLVKDLRFHFVPSKESPREVYHELVGPRADEWATYYTKKGWNFVYGSAGDAAESDGPYRVAAGGIFLDILEPGRLFAAKPKFRVSEDGPAWPIVSLEKKKPLNDWKPNYIRALGFIKKYKWPFPVSRRVQHAIWEIEECGEVAGSVSWINAEQILLSDASSEVVKTLEDVFFHRPEDFPLGSQVYLKVLARLGEEGFEVALRLAEHPIARKRTVVATTLGAGELDRATLGPERHRRRLDVLLMLLEDEDPYVRAGALRSLGRVGLSESDDANGLVAAARESSEIAHRVWAAQAFLESGSDDRKYLLGLVKEDPRPLADLGELGEVLVESQLIDAIPFLIQRLKKHDRQVSADAAEVLQQLTGIDLELTPESSGEEKRQVVKAFQRRWDEIKKERAAHRRAK